MSVINFLRAWIADSLIQVGFWIAPDFYLEQLGTERLPNDT